MLAPKGTADESAAETQPAVPAASLEQAQRLTDILDWLLIAKETLPAINEGTVTADRVAALSALVDRMHAAAVALRDQAASPAGRRAA